MSGIRTYLETSLPPEHAGTGGQGSHSIRSRTISLPHTLKQPQFHGCSKHHHFITGRTDRADLRARSQLIYEGLSSASTRWWTLSSYVAGVIYFLVVIYLLARASYFEALWRASAWRLITSKHYLGRLGSASGKWCYIYDALGISIPRQGALLSGKNEEIRVSNQGISLYDTSIYGPWCLEMTNLEAQICRSDDLWLWIFAFSRSVWKALNFAFPRLWSLRLTSPTVPSLTCLKYCAYCVLAAMRLSITLAALAGVARSTILWDGRFNDLSTSTDLNTWSWSNQVGPYQYYIVGVTLLLKKSDHWQK